MPEQGSVLEVGNGDATETPLGDVHQGEKDSEAYLKEQAAQYDARGKEQEVELDIEAIQKDAAVDDPNLESETPAMPEDGEDKFYNKETGAYNWEAHVKDMKYRLNQVKNDNKDVKDKAKEMEDGIDFTKLVNELNEKGDISESDSKKLESIGIGKDMLQQYVDGMKAVSEMIAIKSSDTVGGDKRKEAILKWAAGNLTDVQKESINTQLNDVNLWEQALLGLEASYNKSMGTEGEKPLIDGTPNAPVSDIYENKVEVSKDMSSNEYKTNPAFRQKVMEKMERSVKLGKDI